MRFSQMTWGGLVDSCSQKLLSRPILVDVLSVETRKACCIAWRAALWNTVDRILMNPPISALCASHAHIHRAMCGSGIKAVDCRPREIADYNPAASSNQFHNLWERWVSRNLRVEKQP